MKRTVSIGNQSFTDIITNNYFYIDKTMFIREWWESGDTVTLITRPRRFGKSMAAYMLAAYYVRSENTENLFSHLKIAKTPSFYKHLNKYDVLMINMQEFLSKSDTVDAMLNLLERRIIKELDRHYQLEDMDREHLDWAMQDIYECKGTSFIILIDEWDCLFREYGHDTEVQKKYLDFLRSWLKDKTYVCLAYMTGILPIKKYGTHSALNMFSEYSMTDSGNMAVYFGFTKDEVRELCGRYGMDFEEADAWYDGYGFSVLSKDGAVKLHIYNPKSVVEAMLRRNYRNYWNQTETYEALKIYIQMNYDGLKDSVSRMLAGAREPIDIGRFSNDMATFSGKDDVMTLLVHLGYLTYNEEERCVSIPNKEVGQEYINAIRGIGWNEVIRSVDQSCKLLEAMWNGNGDAVAEGIDKAHEEVSILQYNDENALSYTINLAFYAAREYYHIVREQPAGKGYADICFIPRKLFSEKPAAIIELKWGDSAENAVKQIKERRYASVFEGYQGTLLLAGINYDRTTKRHECLIEKVFLGEVRDVKDRSTDQKRNQ